MNRNDIISLVTDTITTLSGPINKSTVLFGQGGILDSLDLVSLLADIEEKFEMVNISISLSDDRAISQAHSPFKTVDSLADYVHQLINEQKRDGK